MSVTVLRVRGKLVLIDLMLKTETEDGGGCLREASHFAEGRHYGVQVHGHENDEGGIYGNTCDRTHGRENRICGGEGWG